MSEGARYLGYWDLLIVGAGSAGCTLANRLSKNSDRQVLLLESGPDFPPPASWPRAICNGSSLDAADYMALYDAFYTKTQPRALTVRGRLVGGSSAVNGAWFLRGMASDYDSWGSDLWRYSVIERFFRKLETDLDYPLDSMHGHSGPIPVQRSRRQDLIPHQIAFYEAVVGSGFREKTDLGDPFGQGVGRLPLNKVAGRRISAAMAYIDPVRSRPNLRIWANCTVIRLLIESTRVVGVLAEWRGETIRIEAASVILSAGGLETPTLLVRSGIGPAATLSRLGIKTLINLSGVGQNVHDHPLVGVDVAAPDKLRPRQDDPPHQVMLVHSCASSASDNDLYVVPEFVFNDTLTYEAVLLRTASCGELEFVSSNSLIEPRVHYHYLEHEDDRTRFRQAVRLIVELLEHPALTDCGKLRLRPAGPDLANDSSLDSWIEASLSSAFHTSGTCRMGPDSDPLAVVDDHGSVHGMSNLTIADLSIAPNVVRAPTNATAVMIGERIAELFETRRGVS